MTKKKKTVKHEPTSDDAPRLSNQRAPSIESQSTLWRIFMLDQSLFIFPCLTAQGKKIFHM